MTCEDRWPEGCSCVYAEGSRDVQWEETEVRCPGVETHNQGRSILAELLQSVEGCVEGWEVTCVTAVGGCVRWVGRGFCWVRSLWVAQLCWCGVGEGGRGAGVGRVVCIVWWGGVVVLDVGAEGDREREMV